MPYDCAFLNTKKPARSGETLDLRVSVGSEKENKNRTRSLGGDPELTGRPPNVKSVVAKDEARLIFLRLRAFRCQSDDDTFRIDVAQVVRVTIDDRIAFPSAWQSVAKDDRDVSARL